MRRGRKRERTGRMMMIIAAIISKSIAFSHTFLCRAGGRDSYSNPLFDTAFIVVVVVFLFFFSYYLESLDMTFNQQVQRKEGQA
jgi:hypothetical protein